MNHTAAPVTATIAASAAARDRVGRTGSGAPNIDANPATAAMHPTTIITARNPGKPSPNWSATDRPPIAPIAATATSDATAATRSPHPISRHRRISAHEPTTATRTAVRATSPLGTSHPSPCGRNSAATSTATPPSTKPDATANRRPKPLLRMSTPSSVTRVWFASSADRLGDVGQRTPCMYTCIVATTTISIDIEAYERLRQARRSPDEPFSRVIKRARWPAASRTAAGRTPLPVDEQTALVGAGAARESGQPARRLSVWTD